jgi:hypothetical protein
MHSSSIWSYFLLAGANRPTNINRMGGEPWLYDPVVGVAGFRFMWGDPKDCRGCYTFSVKNGLDSPITDVRILVIFFDYSESVVDFQIIDYTSFIPPKLAKRLRGEVDTSTRKIMKERGGRVEIRVIDFKKGE